MTIMIRWLALIAASLMLTSCLLVPAKFTSTLDIRADRSFTFTYVGEVLLPKSDKPAGSDSEDSPDEESATPSSDEAQLFRIAAGTVSKGKATTKSDKAVETFGDTSEEAGQFRRLATTLANEYGYRSVRYIGNRKLAIDYRITGKLDHAFVFPFNPDGEVFVPFLAIELRGKDRVRVKAPGFANEQAASSALGGMGGLGGLSGSGSNGSQLDGTFTITTNAEIVSQNQEDGAQTLPDGGRKLVWTVTPDTRDAPLAVLRVSPLP
jgi:hypothetical protein